MGEDKPYGLSSILNGPWADKSSKLFGERSHVRFADQLEQKRPATQGGERRPTYGGLPRPLTQGGRVGYGPHRPYPELQRERNPVIGSVTSGGPRLPFIPGVSVEYSVLNDLSSSGVLPPQLGPSLPSRTSTPRQSPRSKYWDDVQARSFGRPNTAPAPYGEWVPSSAFV
eukprot:CAMPEP_0182880060 /NCGR_PEP_ID=MMETSP0034_2-20130328/16344_1 /TAXON_ID=156128 /ORGANISM="Nephroselmis pyriformis, Strain CCMP717" /LENGTH=169 /DNA_ID=CAMNT_0025013031 /DNA_START=137 /DNA_END=642 /DNA_ORIENTATION=+